MSSYASALKDTMNDSWTQTGQSQILSLTSMIISANSSSSIDNSSSLSSPTSAGSSGVAA